MFPPRGNRGGGGQKRPAGELSKMDEAIVKRQMLYRSIMLEEVREPKTKLRIGEGLDPITKLRIDQGIDPLITRPLLGEEPVTKLRLQPTNRSRLPNPFRDDETSILPNEGRAVGRSSAANALEARHERPKTFNRPFMSGWHSRAWYQTNRARNQPTEDKTADRSSADVVSNPGNRRRIVLGKQDVSQAGPPARNQLTKGKAVDRIFFRDLSNSFNRRPTVLGREDAWQAGPRARNQLTEGKAVDRILPGERTVLGREDVLQAGPRPSDSTSLANPLLNVQTRIGAGDVSQPRPLPRGPTLPSNPLLNDQTRTGPGDVSQPKPLPISPLSASPRPNIQARRGDLSQATPLTAMSISILSPSPCRKSPISILSPSPFPKARTTILPTEGNNPPPQNYPLPPSYNFFVSIDGDNDDPLLCTKYVEDVYRHFHIVELKKWSLAPPMGSGKRDRNDRRRIAAIIAIADQNGFSPETLHLAVAYYDQYFIRAKMDEQWKELLSITCLLVASKYEDVQAGYAQDFCSLTQTYSSLEQVLSVEKLILGSLRFDLNIPTTIRFLRRFLRAAQAGNQAMALHMEFLANYLAELALITHTSLRYIPSMQAASIIFMTRLILDPETHPWNLTLERYTDYKPPVLKDCIESIRSIHSNAKHFDIFNGLVNKYSQAKFKSVADFKSLASVPPQFLVGSNQ